jgi:Nitrous oxide-stimulated promoter
VTYQKVDWHQTPRAALGQRCGVNTTLGELAHETTARPTSERTFDRTRGNGRLSRERRTLAAMIECYCRDHHTTIDRLCPECQALLDYATVRLERCRFGELKPTCANCPVHCYQPARREQVKSVMRYSGPRMLWQHPILAVRHLLDGYRKPPV